MGESRVPAFSACFSGDLSSHSRLLIMAETLVAAIPSADAICSRRSVLRR